MLKCIILLNYMGFRFVVIKLFMHLARETNRFQETNCFRRLRVGPLNRDAWPTIKRFGTRNWLLITWINGLICSYSAFSKLFNAKRSHKLVIWVFGRVYGGVNRVVLCLFIIYENCFRTILRIIAPAGPCSGDPQGLLRYSEGNNTWSFKCIHYWRRKVLEYLKGPS